MYGVGRGCRKPWNKSLSKVVSERRKFRLVARCQTDQEAGCEDDVDQLIADELIALTGTYLPLNSDYIYHVGMCVSGAI